MTVHVVTARGYCKARQFEHQGDACQLRHESGATFTSFKEAAAHFRVSVTTIANYAHGRRPSRVGKLEITGRVKKFTPGKRKDRSDETRQT